LGGALLQPLAGAILDRLGGMTLVDGVRLYPAEAMIPAMGVIAGAAAVGWVATLFVRETYARNVTPPRG